MTRRAAARAGWVVLLTAAVAGCSSSSSRAQDDGRADLADEANGLRDYAHGILRERSPTEALQFLTENEPAVYDGAAADTGLTWDAVFITTGDDTRGWASAAILMRACVRFTAQVDQSPDVTWQGIPCPAEIDRARRYGPYDETVVLD